MTDNFIYEEQKQLIKMWKEHCEEIKQQRDTLQSNWDSLREWLIKQREEYIPTDRYVDGTFDTIDEILDKMNELEGVVNE